MSLGFSVLLLISCLIFSAYFSGLETALSSLSTARLKKLIEERPIHSNALGLWLRKPTWVLSTILIGNNLVNTLAAAIAAILAQSYFANYAITIATSSITILLLMVGEITPKTFARHNANAIAPIGMTLLLPIYVLLMPCTYVMSKLVARLLKLLGKGANTKCIFDTTEEDITYLIRLGHEEGVLKRNDGHLLQSVIEFRETVVKESMVPRTEICSFEVDASYAEMIERLNKEGHTRWPVFEKNIDNIIGIFHVKDLLQKIISGLSEQQFSLRDFLRPAKFVPDMMKIGGLLKEFQAGKAHLAIVVDEYGGTAGIITLEDVLEEIVGEIRDEYDREELEEKVQQIDANNYLVSGKANIYELGKVLKVAFLESDAFDSVNGFLTAIHGRMPKVGEKIFYQNCTFVIKAADEKKITSVQLQLNGAQGNDFHQKNSLSSQRVAA